MTGSLTRDSLGFESVKRDGLSLAYVSDVSPSASLSESDESGESPPECESPAAHLRVSYRRTAT